MKAPTPTANITQPLYVMKRSLFCVSSQPASLAYTRETHMIKNE
jgi:hypothetical protein